MQTYDVDLRWSLWSKYTEEFEGRNAEAINAAKQVFDGEYDYPVKIHTAPKKEIRFGTVTFTGQTAEVLFSFDWDEPYEQIWRVEEITGELNEQEEASVREQIEMFFSELDWSVSDDVSGSTFAELMERIDEVESNLLEQEDTQSKELDALLKSLAEWVMEERDQPTNQ